MTFLIQCSRTVFKWPPSNVNRYFICSLATRSSNAVSFALKLTVCVAWRRNPHGRGRFLGNVSIQWCYTNDGGSSVLY